MPLFFLIAFFIFIIDQVTKLWILYILDLEKVRSIEVFAPYLSFNFAWNKGINFGLFSTNDEFIRWLLICFTLLISFFIIIYAYRSLFKWWEKILAGFVLGGALGNIFDRVVHGAVVDFLNMSCCGIVNKYSFKLADLGIFIGVFGLVLFSGKMNK